MQEIAIIGAGPAGLLLALRLRDRGYDRIALYERRPDPRRVEASKNRTFPIALQARGPKALREIPGLETAGGPRSGLRGQR